MISWLLLLGSIVADVLATFLLQASHGFARPGPSVLAVLCFALTIYLYGNAITRISAPIAYALFGAIGTAAVGVIGVLAGSQPRSWTTFAGLGLIVAGVVLLPLASR